MLKGTGRTWICLFAVLLVFAMPDIGRTQTLSGTYTIGGTSPSYASFTAAVTALTTNGISGAVTFNVRAGTYTEKIAIPAITGASASHTITFQSESGVASDVTLRYTPTSTSDNYVIALNGTSHIRIKNLTLTSYGVGTSYRNVLVLDATSGAIDDVTIQGNSLNGYQATYGSSDLSIINGHSGLITTNLTVANNVFTYGGFGIYLYGNGSTYSTGTIIKANSFIGSYTGVALVYQAAPKVDSNTVTVDYDGIDLNSCNGSLSITRNRVQTSAGGYGMTMYNCQGDALDYGLIANNFAAIQGTSGGFGISLQSSSYQNVYYNSVSITATSTGYGIYEYGGSNVSIVNNLFSNTGGSYAYYVNTPTAITTSDHNALYGAGMVFLAHWGNSDCISLPALQVASGMEAHSVSSNPDFTSATDLHVNSPWLDGTGTPVSGVTVDIDGHARNGSTPDIGASEFTSSVRALAAGVYTIGGTSPNYATFTAAVNDLVSRGIAGAVTFSVRPGTYAEQIDFWPVGGVSPANTITFQPASSGVTLQFTQSNSNSVTNWVMRLNSVSHVHLKNMTLASSGLNTSYRNVLVLNGSVDDVVVQGDSLGGLGGNGYQSLAAISGTSAWTRNLTIWGNRFGPASYGIYLSGYGTTADSGTVVKGNSFTGSYGGVYMTYQPAVVIDSNRVNVTYDGIDLNSCPASLSIQRNRVQTSAGGNGITMYNCQGDGLDYGLIANNFVSMLGTSGGYGLSVQSSSYQNVYYNSVNITATSSSYGIYEYGGANVSIEDNIFDNAGGGYAYYVNSPTAIVLSDYNDLTTTGAQVGHWGSTDYGTLAALQAASSMDAHSSSKAVTFVSATDLHLAGGSIGDITLKGVPVAGVTIDIDGTVRSTSNPYMGANEAALPLAVATSPIKGGGSIDRAPVVFQLIQNYPNPFNPSTTVKFSVEKSGRAVMKLYDITGRQVATLFDGTAEAGRYYQVSINGANLASGAYIYRLESGTQSALRKMILLK